MSYSYAVFPPRNLRWIELITRHLALFEPAAMLHDLAFEQSDGTWDGFALANGNFYQNCLLLADEGFKWLETGTHTVYAAVRILYFCVSRNQIILFFFHYIFFQL